MLLPIPISTLTLIGLSPECTWKHAHATSHTHTGIYKNSPPTQISMTEQCNVEKSKRGESLKGTFLFGALIFSAH